jgi:ferritin-like metal-binding protein YciE
VGRHTASQPRSQLGFALVFGVAVSLWSANAGMKALFDALNVVYGEKERRGFIRLNAISLAFTLSALIFMMIALSAIAILPLARGYLGLSSGAGWLQKHCGETEGQVQRLEQVFAIIEKKPEGKTCAAIVGITDEGAEIMEEYKGSPELDAGLLASAQAVEHYEISRYGTLKAWAEELGLDDAVELLEETLDEQEATDEALTEIAKSAINQQAQAAE